MKKLLKKIFRRRYVTVEELEGLREKLGMNYQKISIGEMWSKSSFSQYFLGKKKPGKGILGVLRDEIAEVNNNHDRLLAYLGLRVQEDCSEKLPKIVKIKKVKVARPKVKRRKA